MLSTGRRRGLYLALAAGAGTAALGTLSRPASGNKPPVQPLPPDSKILQAVNRLEFGPRPGDIDSIRQIGLGRWIDQQLHPEQIDDSAVDTSLAGLDDLKMSPDQLMGAYRDEQTQNRMLQRARQAAQKARESGQAMTPAMQPGGVMSAMAQRPRQFAAEAIGELDAGKVVRAVDSKRQLQEVLVDFWSNHFNLDIKKGPVRVLKVADERDVIRPHVLGKFRDLLEASAKSPAMLFYLDNASSTRNFDDPASAPPRPGAAVRARLGAAAAAGRPGNTGPGFGFGTAPPAARPGGGQGPGFGAAPGGPGNAGFGFGFGAASAVGQPGSAGTGFGFGGAEGQPGGAGSGFGFGAGQDRPDGAGPGFGFGGAQGRPGGAGPGFGFGGAQDRPDGAGPGFGFGGAQGRPDGAGPGFGFGGAQGRPGGAGPGFGGAQAPDRVTAAGGRPQGAVAGAPAVRPRAAQRRRGGLNENYGREVMELHTLGVNGGYTQKDVTEVARCFTGWSYAPQTGAFQFFAARHDFGEKTVLGHKIAAGGGISDGETVLDILASSPATAHHIAYELCERFVSDTPPAALVDRAAKVFLNTHGDLREVTKTIITSKEFFSASAFRSKTKSPFEYAVSAVRAMGANVTVPDPTGALGQLRLAADGAASLNRGGGGARGGGRQGPSLTQQVALMGQPLFSHEAPTGYPEDSREWVSSGALLARFNFAVALSTGRVAEVTVARDGAGVTTDGARPATASSKQDAVDTMAHAMLGTPLSANTKSAIMGQVGAVPDPVKTLGLILGSPEFQQR